MKKHSADRKAAGARAKPRHKSDSDSDADRQGGKLNKAAKKKESVRKGAGDEKRKKRANRGEKRGDSVKKRPVKKRSRSPVKGDRRRDRGRSRSRGSKSRGSKSRGSKSRGSKSRGSKSRELGLRWNGHEVSIEISPSKKSKKSRKRRKKSSPRKRRKIASSKERKGGRSRSPPNNDEKPKAKVKAKSKSKTKSKDAPAARKAGSRKRKAASPARRGDSRAETPPASPRRRRNQHVSLHARRMKILEDKRKRRRMKVNGMLSEASVHRRVHVPEGHQRPVFAPLSSSSTPEFVASPDGSEESSDPAPARKGKGKPAVKKATARKAAADRPRRPRTPTATSDGTGRGSDDGSSIGTDFADVGRPLLYPNSDDDPWNPNSSAWSTDSNEEKDVELPRENRDGDGIHYKKLKQVLMSDKRLGKPIPLAAVSRLLSVIWAQEGVIMG